MFPALGVTPPVRIESSSSHVAEGQTLDLNCLVAGQAHAQITWHKRGGSLPAQHQVGAGEPRSGPTVGICGVTHWGVKELWSQPHSSHLLSLILNPTSVGHARLPYTRPHLLVHIAGPQLFPSLSSPG